MLTAMVLTLAVSQADDARELARWAVPAEAAGSVELVSGFHDPEPGKVWTGSAEWAELRLNEWPDGGAILALEGDSVSWGLLGGRDRIRATINGVERPARLFGHTVCVKAPEVTDAPVTVRLLLPTSSPADVGMEDARQLGLSLDAISVHTAPPPDLDFFEFPEAAAPLRHRPTPGFVTISPSGRQLEVEGAADPWVPFGVNYYDHTTTGWAPQIWREFDAATVREQFAAMSNLGVNCVRVFLAVGTFAAGPCYARESELAKLDAMLDIADEFGIRFIPSCTDWWEAGSRAPATGAFTFDDRETTFLIPYLRMLARRYAGRDTIACFDLRNEPMLPWAEGEVRRNQWLEWQRAQGVDYGPGMPPDEDAPGDPFLADYQRFRESLALAWTRDLADALRSEDDSHLVSLGLIQWSAPVLRAGHRPSGYSGFGPWAVDEALDFQMIHFYALAGDPNASEESLRANLAYITGCLAACDTGKPIIIGEFGWFGGESDQNALATEANHAEYMRRFIEATNGHACGWLAWPTADTPLSTDLSVCGGLFRADLSVKPWGEVFRGLAHDIAWYADAGSLPPLATAAEWREATVSADMGQQILQRGLQALYPR